jgi:hypothetical protein
LDLTTAACAEVDLGARRRVGEFVGSCYNLSANPRFGEASQAVSGHAVSIFAVYSDIKREVYAAERVGKKE